MMASLFRTLSLDKLQCRKRQARPSIMPCTAQLTGVASLQIANSPGVMCNCGGLNTVKEGIVPGHALMPKAPAEARHHAVHCLQLAYLDCTACIVTFFRELIDWHVPAMVSTLFRKASSSDMF